MHIHPVVPVPADSVPLFGRGDQDVGLEQLLDIGRVVASELEHRLLQLLAEPEPPVVQTLLRDGLERGDVLRVKI